MTYVFANIIKPFQKKNYEFENNDIFNNLLHFDNIPYIRSYSINDFIIEEGCIK